jgi:Fe-S cluster assembly protein SufD
VVVARQRRDMVNAPVYTRADVIALSEKQNEPTWLREARLVAWDLYAQMPMPGRQQEEWRRTDYRHIRWDEVSRLPNGATPSIDHVPSNMLQPLVEGEQGGMIVFVDGKLVRSQFSDRLAAQGVIFSDLNTACVQHEALVRANLMTKAVKPTEGKFAALHAALWTHGVFVYVPRGKMIEEPMHVVMYQSEAGMTTMGHMLVVVEEAAQATVLVDYQSKAGDVQTSYVGVTELLVGDAANLKYVGLQDWNRQTFEFSHQRARVGRDGQLDWVMGTMGGEFVKAFVEVELDGQGAYGRVSGMFFADQVQLFDHDTQQNHNAPLTTSDLLFKGAAKDEARTVWQGMIKSLPQMQKIDGFQASRNLLLSPDARMDGIPGLEIEADDVRCTHAATFGTLEEQQVFYLMSRGIARADAELMVTEGFFDELLARIPFERVRARLRASLDEKIVGHDLTHRDDLEVWVA